LIFLSLKPELLCISFQIEQFSLSLWVIEFVFKVLNSHQDLMLTQWEYLQGKTCEILWEFSQIHFMAMMVAGLLHLSIIKIKSEEILSSLISFDLLLSLHGLSRLCIEDLHVVLGINWDALWIILICHIKRLIKSINSVVCQESSLLHQFNSCSIREIS